MSLKNNAHRQMAVAAPSRSIPPRDRAHARRHEGVDRPLYWRLVTISKMGVALKGRAPASVFRNRVKCSMILTIRAGTRSDAD
jgi:hypothetical protein